MAKLRTSFHGAREVLALGAGAAQFAVLAEAGAAAGTTIVAPIAVEAYAGAATRRAFRALLAVLAKAGAAAVPAIVAPLAVLAKSGAAARRAMLAPLAVLAEAGAAAGPATFMALAVRALLVHAPPDWVRRRGRFCWNCCSCLHGAKWQRHMLRIWLGAF